MTFRELISLIKDSSKLNNFTDSTKKIVEYIDKVPDATNLLYEISAIPECLHHDSTEEKLFSKASDAILGKAFTQLGLKTSLLTERADSADIIAESIIHNYTLVADAKAFRLSRTAKNQKDFKVVALSTWRKDFDYSVLCSPYFQYPVRQSQIFAQALEHNVCLLSWEHIILMLEKNIKENKDLNLSKIWNFSADYANSDNLKFNQRKNSFLSYMDKKICKILGCDAKDFYMVLDKQKDSLKKRGKVEVSYWEEEIESIKSYSKEKAINELIQSKKINEKILRIESYVRGL